MLPLTHIPKPRRSCSKCLKEFENKQEIYSTLVDEIDEKLKRVDVCPYCFEREELSQQGAPRWKLVKPDVKPVKKLSWKEIDERAFLLLEEAQPDLSDEAKEEAALLALHLLRRKKLVVEKEEQDRIVYRCIDTGREISVLKIGALTQELQERLQQKLFTE